MHKNIINLASHLYMNIFLHNNLSNKVSNISNKFPSNNILHLCLKVNIVIECNQFQLRHLSQFPILK